MLPPLRGGVLSEGDAKQLESFAGLETHLFGLSPFHKDALLNLPNRSGATAQGQCKDRALRSFYC